MKILLALGAFIALIAIARAEQVLYGGTYYRDVEFKGLHGDKAVLSYFTGGLDGGIVEIPWSALPAPFRKANQDLYDHLRQIEKERADVLRAAADPAMKNKIKASIKTCREVETDISGFRGKLIWLTGTLKVSSYYNYGYRDAQRSHFAFQLEDETGSASLYMIRELGADLRKKLLAAGGIKTLCLVEMKQSRSDGTENEIYAELYDARLLTP